MCSSEPTSQIWEGVARPEASRGAALTFCVAESAAQLETSRAAHYNMLCSVSIPTTAAELACRVVCMEVGEEVLGAARVLKPESVHHEGRPLDPFQVLQLLRHDALLGLAAGPQQHAAQRAAWLPVLRWVGRLICSKALSCLGGRLLAVPRRDSAAWSPARGPKCFWLLAVGCLERKLGEKAPGCDVDRRFSCELPAKQLCCPTAQPLAGACLAMGSVVSWLGRRPDSAVRSWGACGCGAAAGCLVGGRYHCEAAVKDQLLLSVLSSGGLRSEAKGAQASSSDSLAGCWPSLPSWSSPSEPAAPAFSCVQAC